MEKLVPSSVPNIFVYYFNILKIPIKWIFLIAPILKVGNVKKFAHVHPIVGSRARSQSEVCLILDLV